MSSVTRVLPLLCIMAVSVTAADERLELTPFLGFTSLDSRSDDAGFNEKFEQGIQLGARFGVRLGERVVIEAEYRYSPKGRFTLSLADPFIEDFNLEVPVDFGSHAVTGGFYYDLTSADNFRPFVGAKIGLERFRTGEDETNLRVGVGGGMRFAFRPGVDVRADAHYVLWPGFFLTDELEHALEVDIGLTLGF